MEVTRIKYLQARVSVDLFNRVSTQAVLEGVTKEELVACALELYLARGISPIENTSVLGEK